MLYNHMNKKQAIKIFKIVAIIYVASFLIINWTDISWLFNYNVVGTAVDNFFNPYPSIDASTMDAYFYPNHSQNAVALQQIKEVKTIYTEKQNILEIPSLSLELPITFSRTTDKAVIMKDLNNGVVYYPGSVYPGQAGQIVILGHSAPLSWPNWQKWQFTKLGELKAGDVILLDYNNKQYKYIVRERTIIEKGQDVPVVNNDGTKNVLMLVSCWPPGSDYQRIVVESELSY